MIKAKKGNIGASYHSNFTIGIEITSKYDAENIAEHISSFLLMTDLLNNPIKKEGNKKYIQGEYRVNKLLR